MDANILSFHTILEGWNIRFINNFETEMNSIVPEVNVVIKRYNNGITASITNFEQNSIISSNLIWNVSLHGAIVYWYDASVYHSVICIIANEYP